MFSSTHAQSLGYFSCHEGAKPPGLGGLPRRYADRRASAIPPSSRRQPCEADSRARCVENAHSSAANKLRNDFHNRPLKPRMVVTDGEDHAAQAASFQTDKELFPTCRTLPIGHLHSEHLAPAFPVNADGHKHCSGSNHGVLPHLLIPCVQDQVGIFAVKLSTAKASQFLIELLVEPTDRTRAKTALSELFADRLDLPSRYSLDVHLGERRHQRLLTALIAFENLGGKPPVAVLGNSQL